jgi:hypothetical protein
MKIQTHKFDRFKIILYDRVLYTGKLEQVHLAEIATTSPAILIATKRVVIDDDNSIMIWYHGVMNDPRKNEELLNFLKANKLYRD